jgi:hypothetical protein
MIPDPWERTKAGRLPVEQLPAVRSLRCYRPTGNGRGSDTKTFDGDPDDAVSHYASSTLRLPPLANVSYVRSNVTAHSAVSPGSTLTVDFRTNSSSSTVAMTRTVAVRRTSPRLSTRPKTRSAPESAASKSNVSTTRSGRSGVSRGWPAGASGGLRGPVAPGSSPRQPPRSAVTVPAATRSAVRRSIVRERPSRGYESSPVGPVDGVAAVRS